MVSAIQILILTVAIGGVLSCVKSDEEKCRDKDKHNKKNPNIRYKWDWEWNDESRIEYKCLCYGKGCPKKRDITIRGRLTHPNRGGQMRAAVEAIMKPHQLLTNTSH